MQQSYIPGSEWLYYKLYTGYKSADNLLIEYIAPFVDSIMQSGDIDKFFFIRYQDPYPHLRLRLHIPTPTAYSNIMSDFADIFSKCIDSKLVNQVTCNTYTRELTRYGGNNMENSEQIFFIDSVAIINLIKLLDEFDSTNEQHRWLVSMRLIDDMLTSFKYNLHAKSVLVNSLNESFKLEFNMNNQPFSKQLNNKYRNNLQYIPNAFDDAIMLPYISTLSERKRCLSELSNSVMQKYEGDLNNLMSSYIHMTMNRLFRSNNRKFELVVYNFLDRYYKSLIAQQVYNPKIVVVR